MGLNSSYSAYKQYYEDGLKSWPKNLSDSDALTGAAKYKSRGIGSGNPTMGLNSSYSAYKQYYEDGLKSWPKNLSDALTGAAKYKSRGIGSGNPSDMGCANAFTMRGRGRGRGRGRFLGRGRSADSRAGSSGDYSGTHSGTQSEYGTRKGECHTCGEQGHYSFECRARDTQGGQKMGAGGAQLEPSNHGKFVT
jgi:hypothetical protein